MLLSTTGSAIPPILPRALGMAALGAVPYVCKRIRSQIFTNILEDGSALTQPFTILVGLLISFRLGDAYKKWDLGARCLTDLHSSANLVRYLFFSWDALSALIICG